MRYLCVVLHVIVSTIKVLSATQQCLCGEFVSQATIKHTRVSQLKTLNIFYLVIYWTQKLHNDFIFLCIMVLPLVGHSSYHKYHC